MNPTALVFKLGATSFALWSLTFLVGHQAPDVDRFMAALSLSLECYFVALFVGKD